MSPQEVSSANERFRVSCEGLLLRSTGPEPRMTRRTLPAPGNEIVRTAFDAVRVTLPEIADWVRAASATGRHVSAATLNNYRDGRREMPRPMRRLFAEQLLRHANRLQRIARRLAESGEE